MLLKNSNDVTTYLTRAKQICNQLRDLQHPISEDDLVHSVLDGLDSAFHLLVHSILANHAHKSNSFDDLFSMLLSEEL